MKQKIYTFGTQRRKLEELVNLVDEYDAIVIDVRYAPYSRVPEWNQPDMRYALGSGYYYSVCALGNVNYRQHDAPIKLADPKAGIEIIRKVMEDFKSVILVCYEEAPADCHRSIVATLLSEALGYPVEHLLRSKVTKEN